MGSNEFTYANVPDFWLQARGTPVEGIVEHPGYRAFMLSSEDIGRYLNASTPDQLYRRSSDSLEYPMEYSPAAVNPSGYALFPSGLPSSGVNQIGAWFGKDPRELQSIYEHEFAHEVDPRLNQGVGNYMPPEIMTAFQQYPDQVLGIMAQMISDMRSKGFPEEVIKRELPAMMYERRYRMMNRKDYPNG